MRTFMAAALVAALTVPAYSQSPGGMGGAGAGAGGGRGGGRQLSSATVDPEKKKAEDKAFNDAIKRIPLPDKKFDPWGQVREPKH
jgi:hypothetical protein